MEEESHPLCDYKVLVDGIHIPEADFTRPKFLTVNEKQNAIFAWAKDKQISWRGVRFKEK